MERQIGLAAGMADVSGFALSPIPLPRSGTRFVAAMKIVWLGEVVSIAAMEVAMDLVVDDPGGMRRGMTLLHSRAGSPSASRRLRATSPHYWPTAG